MSRKTVERRRKDEQCDRAGHPRNHSVGGAAPDPTSKRTRMYQEKINRKGQPSTAYPAA